jgi:hypothetical protein
MRIFKLIGALVVVLAFSAMAVATAGAAETLWKWLPGSAKETFKGTQTIATGKLQIKGGATVECKGGSILLTAKELPGEPSSELLEKEATLELAMIHFTKCKALGLPANSLGDASEVILVHAELHNCMISIAKKEFGLLILPLPVHIEVPSVKALISVLEKGLFIAKLDSEKESKVNFLLTAKQKEGLQGIEKCEGGSKETLLATENGGAEPKEAGLETEILLEFDKTIDKEGETMMEK